MGRENRVAYVTYVLIGGRVLWSSGGVWGSPWWPNVTYTMALEVSRYTLPNDVVCVSVRTMVKLSWAFFLVLPFLYLLSLGITLTFKIWKMSSHLFNVLNFVLILLLLFIYSEYVFLLIFFFQFCHLEFDFI